MSGGGFRLHGIQKDNYHAAASSQFRISCKDSVFTHSHAELGLINEDIQKTAKLTHVELVLALSSFASLPETFTSKKAHIYLLLIHAEL